MLELLLALSLIFLPFKDVLVIPIPGFETRISEIFILLFIIVLIVQMIRKKTKLKPMSYLFIGILYILFLTFLMIDANSNVLELDYTIGQIVSIHLYLLAFTGIIIYITKCKPNVDRLFKLSIVMMSFMSLLQIISHFSGGWLINLADSSAPFGTISEEAYFCMITFFSVLYLGDKLYSKEKGINKVNIVLLIPILINIFIVNSATIYICFIFSLLILLYFNITNRIAPYVIIVIIIGIIAIMAFTNGLTNLLREARLAFAGVDETRITILVALLFFIGIVAYKVLKPKKKQKPEFTYKMQIYLSAAISLSYLLLYNDSAWVYYYFTYMAIFIAETLNEYKINFEPQEFIDTKYGLNNLFVFINKRVYKIALSYKGLIEKVLPASVVSKLKNKISKNITSSDIKREPYENGVYDKGVNLVGHFKSITGIGEGARMYGRAIAKMNGYSAFVDIPLLNGTKQDDESFEYPLSTVLAYDINIVHINPTSLSLINYVYPQNFYNKRYNVGIWMWELDTMPIEWEEYINLFDEWIEPTEYSANIIRKKINKNVTVVPYAIRDLEIDDSLSRSSFNLPNEAFLFLVMFDSMSSAVRKNPTAAIKAFKKAFEKDNKNVGLVIKIGHAIANDVDFLKGISEDYKNIYFVCENLSRKGINSLINLCDSFLSLHRSEGFGSVIAESMKLGKVAIVTNYSGNLDFTKENNSVLVPYKLIDVPKDYYDYPVQDKWADADVNFASKMMKRLVSDKEYYNQLSKNAKKYIDEFYSINASKEALSKRIEQIREKIDGRKKRS